jgi:hypothetical protein
MYWLEDYLVVSNSHLKFLAASGALRVCYNPPALSLTSREGFSLMPDKDSRTAIIVALVGASAVVSAAVIANYDKIFRPSTTGSTISQNATPSRPPTQAASPANSSPTPEAASSPVPSPSVVLTPESTPAPRPTASRSPVFRVPPKFGAVATEPLTFPNELTSEQLAHLLPTLPPAELPPNFSPNLPEPAGVDEYRHWFRFRDIDQGSAYILGKKYIEKFGNKPELESKVKSVQRYVNAYYRAYQNATK